MVCTIQMTIPIPVSTWGFFMSITVLHRKDEFNTELQRRRAATNSYIRSAVSTAAAAEFRIMTGRASGYRNSTA